jgi:hypothetical protein
VKTFMAAVLLTLALPAPAEETKLGAGVTLRDATQIAAITAKPADFVGKTVRVDGVATAVCTHMGCWMAIAPEGQPDAPTVRLKVDDGVIVFPVSAKGKKVSAEGIFEEVKTAEDKEAAAEHAKDHAQSKHDSRASHDAAKHTTRTDHSTSKQYQIKATGAVIR